MNSLRNEVFSYIKKKYDADPEYLWHRYPGYAVFRHSDNDKWFCIIMDVSGFESNLFSVFRTISWIWRFRGYHIARGNWVSILLDGTVPMDEICRWLDESYINTASKAKKQKLRPPKEWIIPANPKYYDVQAAFKMSKEIDWKQGKGIKTGSQNQILS